MPTPLTVALIVLGVLILFFALYLFAVRPRRARKSARYFATFNYAHRGLHDARLPENSTGAFEAACRAGYGIELDVRLSRDGVAMVFHDDTLKRMCGIDRRVDELTAEELSRIPLAGSSYTIPTFADVLALVRGRVPLLVEIKGLFDAARVCEVAAPLLDDYRGPYCIESFSPFAVRWFCRHRPLVVRGQLTEHYFANRGKKKTPAMLAMQLLLTNFLTKPDFIAFNLRDRKYLPFRIATRLYSAKAFAYTVKSVSDEEKCCGYFDALIFEGYLPAVRTADDEN
jgi:glycerophosphoryl diester phosphodiesterase